MEERIGQIERHFAEKFGGSPEFWVRAPGRVDLMGSHTDYNEGYVLTMPLDLDTIIAFTPSEEETITLSSLNVGETINFSSSVPYSPEHKGWISYVSGVAQVFRDKGFEFPGLKGIVQSSVPLGGGLSSSASLECAAAEMLMMAGGFETGRMEVALSCQKAEHEYAGMPCGILDQYTSVMGKKGTLIVLDCRSLSHILVRLPEDIRVVICDTRAPHILVGSEYETRRNQCFEGARILNKRYPEVKTLRDAAILQLKACKDEMTDEVYRRCRFIIEENQRVLEASAAISSGAGSSLGELFTASFQGARDLYEITVPEMEAMHDAMVSAPGVIASRQAGGGFGGCMSSLVQVSKVDEFIASTTGAYKESTGLEPLLFTVSPGNGAGLLAD